MPKKEAIFPFSADPITLGHYEIIERARGIFDRLHLVILNNPSKQYTFSQKERLNLVNEMFADDPKVVIASHEGLLVDFAYSRGVNIIIRGIRNEQDLEFETELEFGNKRQFMNRGGAFHLETIYLLSSMKYRNISSSFAKAIVKDYGAVESYVPLPVKKALEEKFLQQYRLGITGSIACGKSTVAKAIVKKMKDMGIASYYLDLDQVVAGIYRFKENQNHPQLKRLLIDRFGKEIIDEVGNLNRVKLSELAYADKGGDVFAFLNKNLGQAIVYEVRNTLKGLKGLILIDGVRILESGFSVLSNNVNLLVHSSSGQQVRRLMERDGIKEPAAKQKIKQAGSMDGKHKHFELCKIKWRYGRLLEFNNKPVTGKGIDISNTVDQIFDIFPSLKG